MSWGEVKKINSDLGVPLNHLIWLNDYKTYGTNSYVYNDKNIFEELLRSKVAVNDSAMASDLQTFAFNEQTGLGKVLSQIYGIAYPEVLETLNTAEEIAVNEHWDDWFSNSIFSGILTQKPEVVVHEGIVLGLYTIYVNRDDMSASAEYDDNEKALKFSLVPNSSKAAAATICFNQKIVSPGSCKLKIIAKLGHDSIQLRAGLSSSISSSMSEPIPMNASFWQGFTSSNYNAVSYQNSYNDNNTNYLLLYAQNAVSSSASDLFIKSIAFYK